MESSRRAFLAGMGALVGSQALPALPSASALRSPLPLHQFPSLRSTGICGFHFRFGLIPNLPFWGGPQAEVLKRWGTLIENFQRYRSNPPRGDDDGLLGRFYEPFRGENLSLREYKDYSHVVEILGIATNPVRWWSLENGDQTEVDVIGDGYRGPIILGWAKTFDNEAGNALQKHIVAGKKFRAGYTGWMTLTEGEEGVFTVSDISIISTEPA